MPLSEPSPPSPNIFGELRFDMTLREDDEKLHRHLVDAHGLEEAAGRWFSTQEERHDWLRQLAQDTDHASQLASLLQKCINDCRLDEGVVPRRLKFLQDVCGESGQCPASYWLTGVTRGKRCGVGGEATIYEGMYNGRCVVVREFHCPQDGDWETDNGVAIIKLVYRESISHYQLRHPNIVAFVGLLRHPEEPAPSIVMVKAKHNSVMKYLNEYGSAQCFINTIDGISEGIAYLHSRSPPVIHGDLHTGNLVVDEGGVIQLCDFGLSRIRHLVDRSLTTRNAGGRLPFKAPEYIDLHDQGHVEAPGDIYAFAMVMYALATGVTPFAREGIREANAQAAAQKGTRPVLPEQFRGLGAVSIAKFSEVMKKMWTGDPAKRPAIAQVQKDLVALSEALARDTLSNSVATEGTPTHQP